MSPGKSLLAWGKLWIGSSKSRHRERGFPKNCQTGQIMITLWLWGFERAYSYALTLMMSMRLRVSSLLLWRRGIVEVFNFATPLPPFLLSFSPFLAPFFFFLLFYIIYLLKNPDSLTGRASQVWILWWHTLCVAQYLLYPLKVIRWQSDTETWPDSGLSPL